MAAFEDNNPFASPSSPSSSRANSYAVFGNYPSSPTSQQSHDQGNPSFDSTHNNRPTTSSSDDAPGYHPYPATNSDLSVEHPQLGPAFQQSEDIAGSSGVGAVSRDKDGEVCCKIDEILCKNPELRIVITDASKASDGGANFIAYTLEVGVPFPFPIIMLMSGNDVETTIFGMCSV